MKIETQKLGTPKAKLPNCLNKYQRPIADSALLLVLSVHNFEAFH